MPALYLQIDSGAPERVPLQPLPFKIGKRSEDNHLVLPAAKVSREHCVLYEEGGAFYVQDLNSRNGTFLNGRRVEVRAPLTERAVLTVGPYQMTFLAEAGPGGAAQAAPQAAAEPAASDGRRRTPVELKRKLHEEIIASLDLKHSDFSEKSDAEIREKTAQAARAALKKLRSEKPVWLRSAIVISTSSTTARPATAVTPPSNTLWLPSKSLIPY